MTRSVGLADSVEVVEMPEPLFLLITVFWGAVCGLVGGRFPDERGAVARAMGIGSLFGALALMWALASDAEPAWVPEAAVALGIGCTIALSLLLAFGMRPRARD
jgi:hypothetical protein